MAPISSFALPLPSLSSLFPFLLPLAIFFILIEQVTYLLKKRHSPGPLFFPPFVGNALSLVSDPKKFWAAQAAASARAGFAVDYILGRFMVFIRDTHLSHVVFANVRADAFHLVGHPFGKKLFGEHNMIFMFDQAHKDLRRRIAPNFTPKALSTYTALQQIIILKHLKKWEKLSSSSSSSPAGFSRHDNQQSPISLRLLARDLNLETSQTVFVGPYLGDEERKRFRSDYNLFNRGVMCLPIDLPGFAFRNARLAVPRLVRTLTACAEKSKKRMEKNEEPTCLIDFWMQETVKEITAAKASGEHSPPPHSGDSEIGAHLFDFLFAAQDASTSSLLWAVALLDSHPEVLARVREEASGVWSPESDKFITMEELREMKYTQAVAREVVRFRPPATLVPHIASRDFPLTESFTIPKGSIVFPSVYDSSFQGFIEPDRFDPDRFLEGRQEDQVFKKNFLAFGAGAHQCVGQRYALNQLVLFITMFSIMIDFKRNRTDGCDEVAYNPTIIPKDGCSVFLSRRRGTSSDGV